MWNMFRQHGLEQNKGIIATERQVAVLNKQVTEHQTWDSLTWLNESPSISVVAFAQVIDSHHFKLPHSPHCQGVDGQEDQRQLFLNRVPGPPSQHHPRTLTKTHKLRPYRGVLDCAIQIPLYPENPRILNRKVASSEPCSFHARTPKPSVCHALFIDRLPELYYCCIFLCLVCFSPLPWQGARKKQLKGGTVLLWLLAREVQSLMAERHGSRVTSELWGQRGWLVVASLSSLKAKGETVELGQNYKVFIEAPYPEGSTTFPNNLTSWGPTV